MGKKPPSLSAKARSRLQLPTPFPWQTVGRKTCSAVCRVLTPLFLSFGAPLAFGQDAVTGGIHPQISRDGANLVFSLQGAIWKIEREGGNMVRLTDEPGFDIEPAWSPDGRRIAFIRSNDFSSGHVRIISSEDGKAKPLAEPVYARDRLVFDTDGTRILGLFRKPREEAALRWLEVDTGELGPALTPYQGHQRYALSRDGNHLALAESHDADGEQAGNNGPGFTIRILSSEGGPTHTRIEFPARIYDLSWMDDDQSLCVVTNAGGAHNDLWILPLEEPVRGARKITFGQADEDRPTFSGNTQWMAYADNRTGPTRLMLRDMQTGLDEPVLANNRDFRCPTGTLELELLDANTSSPVPARISVARIEGKQHAPTGKLYRLQGSNLHFYATGMTSLTVPAGRYVVTAWRGPEYEAARREVMVTENKATAVTLVLSRWIHQRDRGWFSGETHIHANLSYLVEPIFTGFALTTHPHDHPTNADIGHRVHDQSGHVNNTHPSQNIQDPYLSAYSAKALPLDVALGTVDSIDVMGSNHKANMQIWYRLLNCGFKIHAAAGTDCFLNRIRSRLPGSVRFYVKMDGDFFYDAWIEQFKKGATFATNGPMFEFSVNEKPPGETLGGGRKGIQSFGGRPILYRLDRPGYGRM